MRKISEYLKWGVDWMGVLIDVVIPALTAAVTAAIVVLLAQ